jgi:pilus assembly protein CpaD
MRSLAMSPSRPAAAIIRTALLSAGLALAACDSPVEQWQPVQAPKTNAIEFVRLNHTVRFAPGAAVPAPAETRRLMNFVDDAEIAGGDEIYLDAAPTDRLSQARQASIRRLLSQRGIRAVALPAIAGAGGERLALGDEVALQVERYVVTPPACPNWSKPPGGDPTNTVGSNFGCATTTNLGLMVANPRDLLVGRKPGPADAEPALRAIQNYRAGKPIVLPDDLTGQAQPGATNGGPGSSAGGNATASPGN